MHSTHGSNEAYPWAGSPDDENNELLRTQADSWMHDNLDGYLQWAKTHNSLLIITQDEEHYTGGTWPTVTTILNGDNHLFVPGTDSETINHYNLLRTITDMYGLAPLANAGVSRFNTDAQGRLSGSLATGTSTSLTSSGTSVFGQTITLPRLWSARRPACQRER